LKEEERSLDLAIFHRWSKPDREGNSHPIDTKDDLIAEEIISSFDIFILNGKLYRYIDGVYIMDEDGSMFKTMISKFILEDLRTDVKITRIHRLLLSKYKIRIESSDVNQFPVTWIPFRNGMLDVKTLVLHPHSPKYNCINQLPHDWTPDYKATDTVVEDFLRGTLPEASDREMFLQYVGYAFTTSTHLQKFLIICGDGGLGKSVLLRLVQSAVGSANYSSLTLQNLNDRFSPAFLMGKLMNIYADLPSTDMGEINGIKTITGGDSVRAEYKGGKIFCFVPYCKLLYSANQIPKSRDDRTTAYYRRLLILRITQRGQNIPNLEERLEENIDAFIHLAVDAVHRMYIDQKGAILESANSIQEVNELYKETDTVHAWISDNQLVKSTERQVMRSTLYKQYRTYCEESERTRGMLSANGFYASLRERGFREGKNCGDRTFYISTKKPEEEGFSPVNPEDISIPF